MRARYYGYPNAAAYAAAKASENEKKNMESVSLRSRKEQQRRVLPV